MRFRVSRRLTRSRFGIFFAVAALLCPSAVIAETFRTRDDFSVTLPSGWAEAPPEALRNMEAVLEQLSQDANTEKYDYGYQLASASVWFEYPYILVQVSRRGRVPEGQLTKYKKINAEMREGLEEVGESLGDLVSNMEQGETLYDEADHVLWSGMQMGVQGVGSVRAMIAVKFTEFGFVQLMGYATEDTFEQYEPVFRETVKTMTIDDPYKYQPRLTDHAPTLWGINLGRSAIAALFGGLAGGVIGLIAYLTKKRRRMDT